MARWRVFCLLLLLTCNPVMAQPVTNGGFELLDDNGFPIDWHGLVSKLDGGTGSVTVIDQSHSGAKAMHLKLDSETGMVGLNRKYARGEGAGAMLTALKGGVEFWYKLIAHRGAIVTFNVIPMKADGIELGGHRTSFEIPQTMADGKWHKWAVKYDYTEQPEVKFIQIAPRIHRGGAELVLDDIRFVSKVGGLVGLIDRSLAEVPGREGKECRLAYALQNAGDDPVEKIACRLVLPGHLSAMPDTKTQTLPRLAPDEKQEIEWVVQGERKPGDTIVFTATPGDIKDTMKLEARVLLDLISPSRFILSEREELEFTCRVGNIGAANAKDVRIGITPSTELALRKGENPQKQIEVPAGGSTEAKWDLVAVKQAKDANVLVKMKYGDEEHQASSIRLVIGLPQLPKDISHIGNDVLRIEFPKASFGYGMGLISMFDGQSWQKVGAFPRFARIIYLTKAGARSEHLVYASGMKRGGNFVSFTEDHQDEDGRTWHTNVRFSVQQGSKELEVKADLSCSEHAQLLCFEGPMLYAGEGSDWDGQKTDALFPGLEWLVGNEVSSSTLDAAPPKHLRYAPHPNRVTVPVMTVRHDELMLGIMWNPKQEWAKGHDRVSPVFASPNRFEGSRSHLMGLFVPTVDQWVDENTREASRPFELKKGRTITIQQWILGSTQAGDALAGLDMYFKHSGVTDPLPKPRKSWEDEITFSMQAYLKTLWIPEEGKWWSSVSGNPLLSRPVWSADYCMDLWVASQIVKDSSLTKEYRKRMDEVLPHLGRNVGREFCFHMGHVEKAMEGFANRMTSLISSQGPDGEWRFNANRIGTGVFEGRDYRLLGPHNAVEAGTCAINAKNLLEFSLITGDTECMKAGLKACEFMKRFDVPRAAQVWEVPVHSPDVLASALASHANIRAYELTGEKKYLQEAVRWARTGLPFIYFWNDDRFSFMRYASIPVFGATWFRGAWFGRAVQWNGLVYSRALFDLAPLDDSFPWKTLAEGMVISAMYQQASDTLELALWPDSISCIDATKSRWIFAPKRIMDYVYATLGRRKDPATVIFKTGKGRIHITSPALVRNVRHDGAGGIIFEINYPAHEPYYSIIAPVQKPEKVMIDRDSIACQKELESFEGTAWRYTDWMKMLVLKRHKGGICRVNIVPARPTSVSFLPKELKLIRFDFETPDYPEGWRAYHHLEDLEAKDGVLTCRVTGIDPYMVRTNMSVDASSVNSIRVRMSVTAGEGAQLFWTTSDSARWGEDKRINFPIKPDGQFHEYQIDLGKHDLWKATITAIRLDPTSGPDAEGAEVKVDFLRGEK